MGEVQQHQGQVQSHHRRASTGRKYLDFGPLLSALDECGQLIDAPKTFSISFVEKDQQLLRCFQEAAHARNGFGSHGSIELVDANAIHEDAVPRPPEQEGDGDGQESGRLALKVQSVSGD